MMKVQYSIFHKLVLISFLALIVSCTQGYPAYQPAQQKSIVANVPAFSQPVAATSEDDIDIIINNFNPSQYNITIRYGYEDIAYCGSFDQDNSVIIINKPNFMNGICSITYLDYILNHELKHIECYRKYGIFSGHNNPVCGFDKLNKEYGFIT